MSTLVLYFDTVHNSPGTCSATFCMHGKEHTASLHTSLATSLESHANPCSLRLLILVNFRYIHIWQVLICIELEKCFKSNSNY